MIYLSEKLTEKPRYNDGAQAFFEALENSHNEFRLIQNTRDIWMRDLTAYSTTARENRRQR